MRKKPERSARGRTSEVKAEPLGKLEEIKARRKRRTITSLVILIICLLFTFNIETIFTSVRGALNLGGAGFKSVTTLNYGSSVKINDGKVVQLAGEQLLKAEGGKLQAYLKDGKLAWEKPYGGSKALVAWAGDKIYLVERDSGDFYILDNKGEIKAKREALGKIDRLIAKGDQYAILYKKLEKKILIIDSAGKDKATIDLPYADILDMDYAPKLDLIAVSVFFVENDNFHTNVFLFGTDGKMKGARNFNNQILSRLNGYENQFIGVTEQGLVAFDDKDNDIWHQAIDRLVNRVEFNAQGYGAFNLVIEDKALEDIREENSVAVISPKGEWIFESSLPIVADRIFLGQNRVAILGENQVVIKDFKGRTLGSKTFESTVKEVLWITDQQIGLEFEDRFEWYELSY